jgi:cadmium resistance protein CadD (predicted permease)
VSIRLIGQAIALFAVTDVDDIVLLTLFFGLASGGRGVLRVVIGQYLGFAAILAVAILGAYGARLLPEAVIPYFGLVPLALGLRAARTAWRERRTHARAPDDSTTANDGSPATDRPDAARGAGSEQGAAGPGVFTVAAVTLSNGGDNIGVYVPVFTATGAGGILIYVLVFLALVAVWCAAGIFFASRPLIARALVRWGHILLPVVLISIGLIILKNGHAFGL